MLFSPGLSPNVCLVWCMLTPSSASMLVLGLSILLLSPINLNIFIKPRQRNMYWEKPNFWYDSPFCCYPERTLEGLRFDFLLFLLLALLLGSQQGALWDIWLPNSIKCTERPAIKHEHAICQFQLGTARSLYFKDLFVIKKCKVLVVNFRFVGQSIVRYDSIKTLSNVPSRNVQ